MNFSPTELKEIIIIIQDECMDVTELQEVTKDAFEQLHISDYYKNTYSENRKKDAYRAALLYQRVLEFLKRAEKEMIGDPSNGRGN